MHEPYIRHQNADTDSPRAYIDKTLGSGMLECSEADNTMLEKLPTKGEVKQVLFNSNLNAAPGTDGITSLLYHDNWDAMGDSLYEVTKAIMMGNQPTTSQRTSLMVFGCKPKKINSLLPSDKRRISLMNSDFKLCTGIEAHRFNKTLTHTLSSPLSRR